MARGAPLPERAHIFNNYLSTDGRARVKHLISKFNLSFTPYDYQLEGTCAVASGIDLLALDPIDGDKTQYLRLPILVARAFLQDITFSAPIRAQYPKNPLCMKDVQLSFVLLP